MPRSRCARFLGLLCLGSLFFSGCQIVGGGRGPEETGPLPPGTVRGVVYQGTLSLDGGDISAALELIREGGGEIRGALETTSGLRADGLGRLRGRNLRLTLSYGGDCPGRMDLDGEWLPEMGTYGGVVEAQDCTGQGRGTFFFSAT